MKQRKRSIEKLLDGLEERAKELNCLYRVEEILSHFNEPLSEVCPRIIAAVPQGWQHPDLCRVKIEIEGEVYTSPGFKETPWVQKEAIRADDAVVGSICVYYTGKTAAAGEGPFLKEEAKLIRSIAERLSHFITHQKMRRLVQGLETARRDAAARTGEDWRTVLAMLRHTDRDLYQKVSRKMLNHLCWNGIAEAEQLLQSLNPCKGLEGPEETEDWNIPLQRPAQLFSSDVGTAIFLMASTHFTAHEIMNLVQKWIQEDKIGFLAQALNRHLPFPEVADAIRRYFHLVTEVGGGLSTLKRGVTVALIRRFLSDQLPFINVAKNFMEIEDFYHLIRTFIYSPDGHGKIGGKGAGLLLAAQILKSKSGTEDLLGHLKIPKTWYLTSDVPVYFMRYNNLDEVSEQKYKDLNQIRMEYPNIVQSFKSSYFPPEILNGLSRALDDLGDCPLIVRSSSLLEDRLGTAFSGKYKSLFLANQGTKQKRLEALTDAIAEVYASVFSPDPIEYRAERDLIDFGEEMGILIQEVVGTRVGRYYLPSYAGVAFSHNEFRWSPRIKREDGLVRLVPGLGTRAVDRMGDDYPILVAPGQPNLKVNISMDEVMRYTPKHIDVINLEKNRFETVDLAEFLKGYGHELPGVHQMVSLFREGHLSRPLGKHVDLEDGEPVVNFGGLIAGKEFLPRMQAMLQALKDALGTPVDIEFASDGKDFYLLQCRPQSASDAGQPAPIPRDVTEDRLLFSANRYVSNGRIQDISHVVLVEPERYDALPDRAALLRVGRAVGRLNKLLPKKKFILMGPGRWGCRDDIKSGVSVTYSDINCTAMLVEIAVKKGRYVPELSFGTHFFQDLVESNIRYLPLYPDDQGVVFNRRFFEGAENLLPEFLPEFADLADTVRLIDIPAGAEGKVLRILMNADLDEAVGILTEPGTEPESPILEPEEGRPKGFKYWQWRMKMAERIAANLDSMKYGVAGIYVFGSTKNATAGPESDIDLLVHFRGDDRQRVELQRWFEGWSSCLAEVNFLRTGYRAEGLLDVHIVTDEDVQKKAGYAAKIDAVTDPARPLAMMRK